MDQETNPLVSGSAPTMPAAGTEAAPSSEIVEELLIEEISIDGMCGVY